METRANHLLIGSFVLLATVGLFVFVIWLSRIEFDRQYAYYDIFFEGSVAGLAVGGDVSYRGIKVGSVVGIDVDPSDPSRVRTTVQIREGTVIRDGDQASLQLKGITGVAFVNIEGGQATSPEIVATSDEHLPVIPSRPSHIEQLVMGAPELVARSIVLVDRFAALLNEENQRRFSDILEHLDNVGASLVSRRGHIERIIDTVDASRHDIAESAKLVRTVALKTDGLVDQASQALAAAQSTFEGADQLMTNDAKQLLSTLAKTAQSIDRAAREVESIAAQNKDSLRAFAGDGLNEFAQFIIEARLLVAGLARLAERFESDGARVFFGTRESEFKAAE